MIRPHENRPECDAVLISSGIGTRKLIEDQDYLARLKLDPGRQLLAAQCSGSLVLGKLGLLKNVKVSAYPPLAGEEAARKVAESVRPLGR